MLGIFLLLLALISVSCNSGTANRDTAQPENNENTLNRLANAYGNYNCSAAGIAAYADQLANEARKSCTSNGVGVVKQNNYSWMQQAINQLNPPYKEGSDEISSVTNTLCEGIVL